MEKFDISKALRGELPKKFNKKVAAAVRHANKHKEIAGIRLVSLEARVFTDPKTGDISLVADIKTKFPSQNDRERFVLAVGLIEKDGQLVFPPMRDPAMDEKPANRKGEKAAANK